METAKIGQRVAYENPKNEFAIGTIIKVKGNRALVDMESLYYKRWYNIKNLIEIEIRDKTKSEQLKQNKMKQITKETIKELRKADLRITNVWQSISSNEKLYGISYNNGLTLFAESFEESEFSLNFYKDGYLVAIVNNVIKCNND